MTDQTEHQPEPDESPEAVGSRWLLDAFNARHATEKKPSDTDTDTQEN